MPEPRPWSPPPADPRDLDPRDIDPTRVRGALYGSRLYEQPRHAARRDELLAFVAPPGPLAVEVGFDHGMCILDHARRWPEVRWLGLEIREARVEAARPHAPENCLLWRGDARTVLGALLPAGRVDRIDILFPDPVWNELHRPKYLLFSPAFAAILRQALAPAGVLHVATDVGPYFGYIESLLVGWEPCDPPPVGPVLSRRERVCRRDAIPVSRGAWRPPVRA